jgi:hypothetical protein
MSISTKMILSQVMELSDEDRASVAEQLLLSLTHPNPVLDEAWANEAEARIAAYERGEIEARSIHSLAQSRHEHIVST